MLRYAEEHLSIYKRLNDRPLRDIPVDQRNMVSKVRQVDQLIASLKVDIELETKDNNEKHSFDVEYKVREHVKAILKQLLLSDESYRRDYRIESERSITIYD